MSPLNGEMEGGQEARQPQKIHYIMPKLWLRICCAPQNFCFI